MKHKLLTGSLSFTVGMGFSALPAVAQQSPASTEVKPNVITVWHRKAVALRMLIHPRLFPRLHVMD